jgi:hypothetical protein
MLPPRLQALREIVQDLMNKGVIRKLFAISEPCFFGSEALGWPAYGGRLPAVK